MTRTVSTLSDAQPDARIRHHSLTIAVTGPGRRRATADQVTPVSDSNSPH